MKRSFKNKTIVITGALGNLGKAINIRSGKSGARIAALDYDQIALVKLEKEMQHQEIIFLPFIGSYSLCCKQTCLARFFESLGTELVDKGVHCLMVCPSFIQAPKEIKQKPWCQTTPFTSNKKTISPSISADKIANALYKACLIEKKT